MRDGNVAAIAQTRRPAIVKISASTLRTLFLPLARLKKWKHESAAALSAAV
jgi:hypothetical protein